MNIRKSEESSKVVRNAILDYQAGLIPLGEFIDRIESLLDAAESQSLRKRLFDHFLALEEVFARTRVGDFDFERDGGTVVENAIREIWNKTESDPHSS